MTQTTVRTTVDRLPDRARLFYRGVGRLAERARTHPWAFYDFVMVDPENPTQRMRCAPHQQLGMEFVLHHRQSVIRWPTDSGKTQFLIALLLWWAGHEPSSSSLWASKTQGQSKKPLAQMRALLEHPERNARLRAVFPRLTKTPRPGDQWGMTSLTIAREQGSGDPTIRGVGLDTSLQGAKVRRIVGDDLLDRDNCSTVEGRAGICADWESRILSRLTPDPEGRAVLSNVPWHLEDPTFVYQEQGVPTLEMDVWGNIEIHNADDDFDTDLVRPSRKGGTSHRLTAHDPDPEERVPLFPERWPMSAILEEKRTANPTEFARSREVRPRSDEEARCKQAWVDGCFARGSALSVVEGWDDSHPLWHPQAMVFTGVDLAFGEKEGSHKSALVTFAVLPSRLRVLLRAYGKRGMTGPELVDEVLWIERAFGGVIMVETNAAQLLVYQFARERKIDLRIGAHFTTATNKRFLDFGVEGLFTEMFHGLWAWPALSRRDEHVANLERGCLHYQPPPAHTDDYLMALWIAQHSAKRLDRGEVLIDDQAGLEDAEAPRAIRRREGYQIRRGKTGGF